MRLTRIATATAAVAFLLLASPALAGIVIEDYALADGRRAFALGGRLFVPGADGALRPSGDGSFALRNGEELSVRSGKLRPPRARIVFDPQPEPPGIALRGALASGEKIVLVEGKLYFLENGLRRLCPDGTYELRGGARAQVRDGQVAGLSSLTGFSPDEMGIAAPGR